MDSSITVQARTVYGSLLLYPVGVQAVKLAAMLGTKTLTLSALVAARGMGFEIEVLGDTSAVLEARRTLSF